MAELGGLELTACPFVLTVCPDTKRRHIAPRRTGYQTRPRVLCFPSEILTERELAREFIALYQSCEDERWVKASVSHNEACFDMLDAVATDPTAPRADIMGCTSAGLEKEYFVKIGAVSFSRMHGIDV